ncbi:hypothetical protein EDD11_009439 [Mortierella claussenii]|nr:hypothetical protein EDD11_009439 [Mortierella claussenii]
MAVKLFCNRKGMEMQKKDAKKVFALLADDDEVVKHYFCGAICTTSRRTCMKEVDDNDRHCYLHDPDRKCRGYTLKGDLCGSVAKVGEEYCRRHRVVAENEGSHTRGMKKTPAKITKKNINKFPLHPVRDSEEQESSEDEPAPRKKSKKPHTPDASEACASEEEVPAKKIFMKNTKQAKQRKTVFKTKKTSKAKREHSAGEESVFELDDLTKKATKKAGEHAKGPEQRSDGSDASDGSESWSDSEDIPDEYGMYESMQDKVLPATMCELAEKIQAIRSEIKVYGYMDWRKGNRHAKLVNFKEELLAKYRECKKDHMMKYGTDEPTEDVFKHLNRGRWTKRKVLKEIGCLKLDREEGTEGDDSSSDEPHKKTAKKRGEQNARKHQMTRVHQR